MTYGQAITGVAPTTLLRQRRAAAAVAAPAAGPSGQDIDLALILAEEGPTGCADPAFDAHVLPIHAWALAAWQRWLPLASMDLLLDDAHSKFAAAKSIWQHVKGPGAATLATIRRLNWTAESAVAFTTDAGRKLNLQLDPPIVVKAEVVAAVRRWREAAVFHKFSHLGDYQASYGLLLAPVWKLLRIKDTPEWSAKHKGALRSAIADRQWPQDRCWTADMTSHDRCLLCVGAAKIARTRSRGQNVTHRGGDDMPDSSAHAHVAAEHAGDECGDDGCRIDEPTAADIEAAPVGTLLHRVCHCPQLGLLRAAAGPRLLRHDQREGVETPAQLCAAYASGLFPVPRLVMDQRAVPPAEGTFEWIRGQELGYDIIGVFYTDGSCRDAQHGDTKRLGWSFVVMGPGERVIAAARGYPPAFITDNTGAEAWALLQAIAFCGGGSSFRSDSKPCVDGIASGRQLACSARRPLARVFNLLFDIIEFKGVSPYDFVWLPAHMSQASIGRVYLGNGAALTATDIYANALADAHAKAAAKTYALDQDVLDQLLQYNDDVTEALRWLGTVTWSATHGTEVGLPAHRDSGASRLVAGMVKRARHPTAAGRHGTATRSTTGSDTGRKPLHHTHTLMTTGRLRWCSTCGAYSMARGRLLTMPCPGKVGSASAGGRAQQLRFLQQGKHPKTGALLCGSTSRYDTAAAAGNDGEPTTAAGDCAGDDTALLAQTAEGRRRLRVRARLAGVDPPEAAVAMRPVAAADQPRQCPTNGGAHDDATANADEVTASAKRRRLALRSLLEAARAPVASAQHVEASDDARPVPDMAPELDGQPMGTTGLGAAEADCEEFNLEHELARIIGDATHTGDSTMSTMNAATGGRRGQCGQSGASRCDASSANDSDGRARPATGYSEDSGVRSNSGSVAVQSISTMVTNLTTAVELPPMAEKRRLLGTPDVATIRGKRSRIHCHPALLRSKLAPLPSTRCWDHATNSRGELELSLEVDEPRKRGVAVTSSDDENHSSRKRLRQGNPAGSVSWRPIHLPRQRHKPGAAKVKQSATQATGSSFGGG